MASASTHNLLTASCLQPSVSSISFDLQQQSAVCNFKTQNKHKQVQDVI